jgi:hypothetical protein
MALAATETLEDVKIREREGLKPTVSETGSQVVRGPSFLPTGNGNREPTICCCRRHSLHHSCHPRAAMSPSAATAAIYSPLSRHFLLM